MSSSKKPTDVISSPNTTRNQEKRDEIQDRLIKIEASKVYPLHTKNPALRPPGAARERAEHYQHLAQVQRIADREAEEREEAQMEENDVKLKTKEHDHQHNEPTPQVQNTGRSTAPIPPSTESSFRMNRTFQPPVEVNDECYRGASAPIASTSGTNPIRPDYTIGIAPKSNEMAQSSSTLIKSQQEKQKQEETKHNKEIIFSKEGE